MVFSFWYRIYFNSDFKEGYKEKIVLSPQSTNQNDRELTQSTDWSGEALTINKPRKQLTNPIWMQEKRTPN